MTGAGTPKAWRQLGEILTSHGKVTVAQVEEALSSQKMSGTSLGEELVRRGMITEDDLKEALAEQFGLEILHDLSTRMLSKEFYEQLPYSLASKHKAIPIADEAGEVVVAVSDPLNLASLEELRFRLNKPVRAVYAPEPLVVSHINRCYEREEGAAGQLLADMTGHTDDRGEEVQVYDLLDDAASQPPIVRLLNLILSEAIQAGASDIHFEPQEEQLQVRYRVDGVLQRRHSPPPEYTNQLLTRIKVMAKLDIAERRLPQDGRIKLRMGSREIDFRVSTIPVAGGERIVLRILDKGNVLLGLDQIGMPQQMAEKFQELIQLPEGIILVTGPTGSGKTTTLYSAICDVRDDETNIMTIEDPVEYKLKGIAQIGVRPKIGLNFAAGLRHILRQDPDIIMVGEIRDAETAEIAIQSSLTGHLVLSTLHTNDAPSAITRLVDMGIEPFLISSTLVGVLAQRLVRQICPDCKQSYPPSAEELEQLNLQGYKGEFYRGTGCDHCFQSGYRGRHGVYELMAVDSAVQHQIVQSPDALSLRRLAKKGGMATLRAHGAQLVQAGVTTLAEVLRVTRAVSVDEEV